MCRRFDSAPNHQNRQAPQFAVGLFLCCAEKRDYLCGMATQLKCTQCGEWGEDLDRCPSCAALRQVHSTFANQENPNRHKAFEMPTMEWNTDPQIPHWKRSLINAGKAMHWAVLAVGGAIAWMAYWVAV